MIKNSLFCAVKLTRNTIKSNFIYIVYGITFDEVVSWSFGNEFGQNVIFGVDNSLSTKPKNRRNNFF